MNKLFNLLFLLIAFVVNSCKKDETLVTSSLNVPIIKGFICRNEVGDLYTIIGTPDVKLNDSEPNDPNHYNYSIISAPTPNFNDLYGNQGSSSIYFYVQSFVQVNSASFWIEKGEYGKQADQSMQVLGSEIFVANSHYAEVTQLNLVTGFSSFLVDVSKFDPGYYRAYLKVNDVLLWDNLIINLNPF